MLSPKQNVIETMRGGNPDRFVKQFEFFPDLYFDPFNYTNPFLWEPTDKTIKDYWGITYSYPPGVPASFPVHKPGFTVIEDPENWKDVLVAPPVKYDEELWDLAAKEYAKWSKDEYFVGPTFFSGLFDMMHHLMGMENALANYYEYPDEMHEIIDFVAAWETDYVREICEHLHPNALLQHDDWGSSRNTFLSKEMFDEFFLEPYKEMYGAFREFGIEYIVHHSDCYAATLVPEMIEMGVDIWQGGTELNDIPSIVKQYGKDITIMSGIDSSKIDVRDWTREMVFDEVSHACRACGTKYFIPCQTNGASHSIYPEVYPEIDRCIDEMSKEMFND